MCVWKLFAVCTLFCFGSAKEGPYFIGTETNVTVVVGRDATLTCKLANLENYKVAWLRVDTQTILTIGPHVITKNHRVGVFRGDPTTWALTLRDARPLDAGRYMCQINTEPMITQTHHLQVVVPPDIVESSSEVMFREGDNVSLHCSAEGTPQPTITWRRENFAPLTIDGKEVSKWSGTWLNMSDVMRTSNGPFFCIATNGVPPSVSKRILLHVLCQPSVWAVTKMFGGYIGSTVLLQCIVEANPAPSIYWTHIDATRLQDGPKYQRSMKSEGYHHTASLSLRQLSRSDIGTYRCHADNSLGSATADINLYTLATTTTTTASTTTSTVDPVTETTTGIQQVVEKHEYSSADDKAEEPSLHLEKKPYPDDERFVVVLSQHQMQNLDFPPTS